MIYLAAVLCGLLLGAALGFGAGLAAAEIYASIGGARDGGPAMAGFFYIGPFGLIAGFLLGVGLTLHYGGAVGMTSRWLFWGAGIVALSGVVVLIAPIVMQQNQKASLAQINLELQFAVGIEEEKDPGQLRWGYQGEAQEAKADHEFYNRNLVGDVSQLQADIQMVDNPARRLAHFSKRGKAQSFTISKTGLVHEVSDWSEWQQGDGVKFRWRMAFAQ